jgi:hypothetical protein
MKAAVKKKKFKNKKKKEKSLPNLFKYIPGPGAKLSGSRQKFSDRGGKIPGPKIPRSWGGRNFPGLGFCSPHLGTYSL